MKLETTTTTGYYLTTKQIATQLACSERHVRDLMHEMLELERYEPEDILRDAKLINVYALLDYLKYRKPLKMRERVPEFDRRKWAEVCPVVERWRI